MSKSLDQLAKDLAGGVSRRKAIWQFVSGLGVVAAFTGRKAFAGSRNCQVTCHSFIESQVETFKEMLTEYSQTCPPGYCASFPMLEGVTMNSTTIITAPYNLSYPFVCVPVDVAVNT
jgi:hypothetical protein